MWADPDSCHLLVRRPWWRGLRHWDDFNQFVIFVYNSDDDHTVVFLLDDSFPLTG
jgi:hypothetical protein